MTMTTNKREPVPIYPEHVDWDSFDDDDLEQIDMAVSLLTEFVEERKTRPEVIYIKNMFLDAFDGFEDTTPEMAVAITEKLCEVWDATHADKAAELPQKATYADHLVMNCPPGTDEALLEELHAAGEKIEPYMGQTDRKMWAIAKEEYLEDAIPLMNEIDCVRSKINVKPIVDAHTGEKNDETVMERVNSLMFNYVYAFNRESYLRAELDERIRQLREEEGIGTPVYTTIHALREVMERSGIDKFDVSHTPMDFIKDNPIAAVITVSWLEGDEFFTKSIYGRARGIVDDYFGNS